MTTQSHSELKDLAGAYVLDALEPDERLSFERHLATCDECAGEVRDLGRVVDSLAQSVPGRTPPPELRQRVLASFARTTSATLHRLDRPTSQARNWLPLAAMLLLTLGIATYATRLHNRVADLEARLEQAILQASAAENATAEARRVSTQLQSAMGVLAAPDLVRIDLAGQGPAPQASARALWSRARGMVFTAANLPPLPAGRVYQVWVVTAQTPVSAGLLTPDPEGTGQTFFNTAPDIPPPAAVAVSIEPEGGVPAPTGEIYLVGKPGAAS